MSGCFAELSVPDCLRHIQKLQREKRFRDERLEFFAEGIRNLVCVVSTGIEIKAIVFSSKLLNSSIARKMVRQLVNDGVPVIQVSPEQFRQISQAPRASGIGLIVSQVWTSLERISLDNQQPWIVLSKLNSAGNLGTMIRSSESLGGAGFILLDKSVDPFEPACVRASMGAIFRQQFIRTRLKFLRKWMERSHVIALGASPDGSATLPASRNLPQARLMMFGEEQRGLTTEQREACAELVSIPMVGLSDSLNVSVATSLFLYERLRCELSSAARTV